LSLIQEVGKNFEGLPTIFDRYEAALQGYNDNLKIKGKNLEHANREQPSWYSYYDERRIELYTLVKHFEGQLDRVRGKLFKTYTETYSRELSDRAKDKYIDNEESYLNMLEIYLEVKELYNKYEMVVEAFRTRGFALNNITKIRVASLEDVTI